MRDKLKFIVSIIVIVTVVLLSMYLKRYFLRNPPNLQVMMFCDTKMTEEGKFMVPLLIGVLFGWAIGKYIK